ncbi:MAG: helix-turn-helix domain-containing protein [Burkholderiaceae bacterium]
MKTFPSMNSTASACEDGGDPLVGINFKWDDEPATPKCVFASPGLHVHHIAASARAHTVRMHRSSHTLLIFDEGSYSDGGRRIEGKSIALGSAGDAGVDVLPAGSELVGWSTARSQVGVTIISVDDRHYRESLHGGPAPRVGVKMRHGLLPPLLSRLRRWASHQWSDVNSLHAESVLQLLLHEVIDAQQCTTPPAGGARNQGLSFRAQRIVREFIAENLDSKICLDTLADQVGISRFHFARAFKTSFGMPPYKYVLNERVRRAAAALHHSQASITDIALDVGFSCSSEMSRCFRQLMGCSPRDYRASRRGSS